MFGDSAIWPPTASKVCGEVSCRGRGPRLAVECPGEHMCSRHRRLESIVSIVYYYILHIQYGLYIYMRQLYDLLVYTNQLHFLQVRRQLMTDSNAMTLPWHPMTFSWMWGDADPSCFQTHRAGTRKLPDGDGNFGSWCLSLKRPRAPRLSVRRWIRRRKNRQTVREVESSKIVWQVLSQEFLLLLFVPVGPPTFINFHYIICSMRTVWESSFHSLC